MVKTHFRIIVSIFRELLQMEISPSPQSVGAFLILNEFYIFIFLFSLSFLFSLDFEKNVIVIFVSC